MCSMCPAGKYSTNSGLNFDTDCTTCSYGTYSTVSGATVVSTCIQCSPGTYSALNGAQSSSSCIPCTTGKYSTSVEAINPAACIQCPSDQCPNPGQYSTCGNSSLGGCSQCQNTIPPNSVSYYLVEQGYNPTCPTKSPGPGYYRNCTNPRAVMWIEMLPLDYGSDCLFRGIDVNNQPYYFCSSTSMFLWWKASQWVVSVDFTSSTTGVFTGSEDAATILYANLAAAAWEIACPGGTYAPTTGSTACIPASPGNFVASFGASAQTPCGPSLYSSSWATACSTNCPPSTYKSPTAGQCAPNLPGTYSSTGTATPCPQGTYSSGSGALACTGCIAGTYSISTGGVSTATCSLCAAGTYTSSSLGFPACTACSPGTYNPATGATTCTPCTPGKYASGLGSGADCALCGAGAFTNSSGRSVCMPCAAGRYAGSGLTMCPLCLVGKFSNTAGSGDCISCTNGTTYTTNTGSTVCTACTKTCATGNQIQGQCTPSSDTYCGACTLISNCFYIPGASCGNTTNPNCLCLPGFELTGGQCQQCRQGFFRSTNSSLPCTQWTSPLCALGYYLSNGTRFRDSFCVPCPNLFPGNATAKNTSGCSWGCKAGFNYTLLK